MAVPNAAQAVVPPEKLTAYLLAHPVGASKARFFRAHGFDDQNADVLADGFCRIVAGDASSVRSNPFGTKYVVSGDLLTPHGTVVQVETVWIVEPHDDRPRVPTKTGVPPRISGSEW